jgi:hypothetical protein
METGSPSPAAPVDDAGAPRGDKTLPLVLLIAVAVVGGLLIAYRPAAPPAGPHPASGAASQDADWTPAPQPEGETVSLSVDFGNGARRTWTLPWAEGMTVERLLQRARDFRPGIAFEQRGEGDMAFVTSLEGVANGTSDGRSWLYSVDGRDAKVSFAIQPVAPGAVVLWEFRRGE